MGRITPKIGPQKRPQEKSLRRPMVLAAQQMPRPNRAVSGQALGISSGGGITRPECDTKKDRK